MAHAFTGSFKIRYALFVKLLALLLLIVLGLPAHNHGQTWLGLVHGMKRWFIYPPGYGPPPEVEEQFNPLLTVNDWLDTIYPLMASYPKPPLSGSSATAAPANTTGYRPLECVQMPGEVFYLPAKWSHTTLNIGEAIALGGQEKSYDNIEYVISFNIIDFLLISLILERLLPCWPSFPTTTS